MGAIIFSDLYLNLPVALCSCAQAVFAVSYSIAIGSICKLHNQRYNHHDPGAIRDKLKDNVIDVFVMNGVA